MQNEIHKLKDENQNLLNQLNSSNSTVQAYRTEADKAKLDNDSLAFNREMMKNQQRSYGNKNDF